MEFAIILPILLIMILGITELGRALYQQNMLTKAVTSGARYMARAYGALDGNCAPTPTWTSFEGEARNIVVFDSPNPGSGTAPILPGLDSTSAVTVGFDGPISEAVGGSPTNIRACIVTVSAHVPFHSAFGRVVPLIGLGEMELNARSEERFIGD